MLEKEKIEALRKKLSTSVDDVILIETFKLLGDKNRFRIIKMLTEEKELCVSELAAILDTSMSAVSQHLRILEMSGLVEGKRCGQMMCYTPLIDHPKVKAIIKLMDS
ncbi:MAG: winged helix-turn-helix transcriptional regulator [Candidatus Nomurabacteria bacterium]|nr:winged helix-turn-helix transcriptional regulator [Candidatus Nomurabacteria bacterium]USN87292.1 MAG: winged helix-turn-helix transcriptional regulator [Candidatus Nomurabacteria bacterium]